MKVIISFTKRYGGVTTFLYNFLKTIDLKDEDIVFLDKKIDKNIQNNIEDICSAKIILMPSYFSNVIINRFMQGVYILYFLKKEKISYDKIFFSDWNIVLDWVIHLSNKKIISFVHAYPNRKLPGWSKRLLEYFTRNTDIITVSEYSAEKISSKWNLDKKHINVLYNYSNLPGNKESKKIINEFRIVTIAHCETYKNPSMWLKVAKKITSKYENVTFHWYGDGTLYNKYKELTKDEPNIIFHGYTNSITDILDKKTNLYIQCSLVESFGISIVDAMNYSIPIIVTDVGGMPETVVDGYNGYICNNEKEFINRIESLITDPKNYNKLSTNSKVYYEKKFSYNQWKKNIATFI